MSTQKVLINFTEYKKLKEIEKKYHELQAQLTGMIIGVYILHFYNNFLHLVPQMPFLIRLN